MLPSQLGRQSRIMEVIKVGKPTSNRRWRLCARLGGRFCKKLILIGICVSIMVFISSLDKEKSSEDEYMHWQWSIADMTSWMSNMSEKMDFRKQHLKAACASIQDELNLNKENVPNPWEFLINTKHHIIWCNVFKAASSSWMYNFNLLAGYKKSFLDSTKQVPVQLARKQYPRPTMKELVEAQNHSVTFIIVRHPFERLLSGYRDKLLNALPLTLHHKLNIEIIKRYRKVMVKRSRERKIATFSEFVTYLLDEDANGNDLDMHWAPINKFCTPCQINFDIILKFETIAEDQNYLIQSQGLSAWIHPEWKNPKKGRTNTADLIPTYYSNLTKPQVDGLYKMYRYDFLLFNYSMKGYREYAMDVPGYE